MNLYIWKTTHRQTLVLAQNPAQARELACAVPDLELPDWCIIEFEEPAVLDYSVVITAKLDMLYVSVADELRNLDR